MPRPAKQVLSSATSAFDLWAFLNGAAIAKTVIDFPPLAVIYAQGDPCPSVMYIQRGVVKLSVVSRTGREAIVAMLGPGDFLGEAALEPQCVRLGTATAVSLTTVLAVPKADVHQLLQDHADFASRFIEYMLARNLRIEEDLIDQLFNLSEKRLARTLLLLARYSLDETLQGVLTPVSQEMLAEMIGTTRSRVNVFMNKFRRLGFIEYDSHSTTTRGLRINTSLLSLVLLEKPPVERKKPLLLPKALNVLGWASVMAAGGYLLAA